jgi:hypothetical protein
MESILGSFDALQANTWTADVQYRVFVTSERAVAARTGGQFGGHGQQLLAQHFGLLGVLVQKLFLEKREARRKAEQLKSLEQCTPAELLARHPKNFEVPWYALKHARFERKRFSGHGPSVAALVLEPQSGAPMKLLLQTAEQLVACRAALGGVLEGRLRVDPKLPGGSPVAARARAG